MTEAAIIRAAARDSLTQDGQQELGQFFTPVWIADLLASMFTFEAGSCHLLDPGAGSGTLFTAFAAHAMGQGRLPQPLLVTAFEIDEALRPYLERSARAVEALAGGQVHLRFEDFADAASREGLGDIFTTEPNQYDAAILNPPYQKLSSQSDLRARLDALDIKAPNLYAAFLGLAVHLVRPGGQVVAIVPRSFCNGTYFRGFREYLFGRAALRRIHLFTARNRAFGEDKVLQENVVVVLEPGGAPRDEVVLSFSGGSHEDIVWSRSVSSDLILRPDDLDLYVHIPESGWDEQVAHAIHAQPSTLADFGIRVSTGPVVDFRTSEYLTTAKDERPHAPLLYPANFRELKVRWPVHGRKPQGILLGNDTRDLLSPSGWYVVTKRFTSKEEPRRIVASVLDPSGLPGDSFAFENHINYFHRGGRPLEELEAIGLATYLNSGFIDSYFRQFSGHTQVNATDLRKLPVPSADVLDAIGSFAREAAEDDQANYLIRQSCPEFAGMPPKDPTQKRLEEAVAILAELGLPREQVNERSALTLLALLGLTPHQTWSDADSPMIGITPIMSWAQKHYDRTYAPNTRETFRRFTMHQFLDAGLAVPNPDKPGRPPNSPKYCYQIEASALTLLRTYGTDDWPEMVSAYLETHGTLKDEYAQRREMEKISLQVKGGLTLTISPGGQNELVREIVEEFGPRFAPGGEIVYIGDAAEKWAYFDEDLASQLGIAIDKHGKMPDVVIYDRDKDWLLLIEAVTSHGPVNPKRMRELKELLERVRPGLVFVTAFLDRKTFLKYLGDIAWQTEVWIAESPGHMVHFDGERFLGPYDD
jgi:adenine-specific DNA-methyltransferase